MVHGGTVDVVAGGDALKSDEDEDASLGFISITAGSLDLVAGADAVEAVTAVLVSGGDLILSADDDGIHSEAWLEISGGSVDITGSYEGLEGTQIVISGGATSVVAEDEGLNVSDGSGSGGPAAGELHGELSGPPAGEPGGARGQRPGPGGPVETPIEGLFAEVSGGTLVIDADGDGFESNGVAAMLAAPSSSTAPRPPARVPSTSTASSSCRAARSWRPAVWAWSRRPVPPRSRRPWTCSSTASSPRAR